MKNLLSFVLLLIVSSGVAFADSNCSQGLNAKKATVAEALKMNNDDYVSVQGNIVKKLSHDKYSFKDSTGTMVVEIDDDDWLGIPSNTNERLELVGEIEKKHNKTELDVDMVKRVSR